MWPAYAGGAIVFGALAGGMLLRRESVLSRIQSNVEPANAFGVAGQGSSTGQFVGLMAAFLLTQVPVEEVKLRLLKEDALKRWGAIVGCFDLDLQQVALGALRSLLDGDAAVRAH